MKVTIAGHTVKIQGERESSHQQLLLSAAEAYSLLLQLQDAEEELASKASTYLCSYCGRVHPNNERCLQEQEQA